MKHSSKRHYPKSKGLPDTSQRSLFAEVCEDRSTAVSRFGAEFHCPSSDGIFIGEIHLGSYLKQNGLGWVIRLRKHLEALDWSLFEASYDPLGRKAFHPLVMMGLTLYGILNRQGSLRELESLGKRDVGAWWLTGGLQPDHSTLGNFLVRHRELLSETFFLSLTRELIKRLRLSPNECAGDGTVIEAAASRYRRLSAEAAVEAAREARERAEGSPDNAEAKEGAEKAEEVAAISKERAKKAKDNGGSPKTVRVNPTEPDAVFQPLKNGTRRFGYKPSVVATPERLIAGQDVQPSNENASVEPLLNQYETLMGGAPTRTMWDGNYHNARTLDVFADRQLDALCPSGSADLGQWEKTSGKEQFPKSLFRYDADRDEYRCPAGERMIFLGKGQYAQGVGYRRYGKAPCAQCEQREKCGMAVKGRTVKRFDGDLLKEMMTQVMAQPAARKAYKRRKAMVEPIFAELRERLGLKRFRRRGLTGVRLEFSLYCSAYNLKRALALLAGSFCSLWALFRQKKDLQMLSEGRKTVLAAA